MDFNEALKEIKEQTKRNEAGIFKDEFEEEQYEMALERENERKEEARDKRDSIILGIFIVLFFIIVGVALHLHGPVIKASDESILLFIIILLLGLIYQRLEKR